jgi:hypothetical protein
MTKFLEIHRIIDKVNGDHAMEINSLNKSLVETMSGDPEMAAEVEKTILGNLEMAKKQKERFEEAEIVIFVTDCPDVRVDFPMSAQIQDILSKILGKKVAVVPLGAFGGGFDLAQIVPLKQKLEAMGKEVLVLEMAHAKNDEGTEGCGALGANEAIKNGTAHLPPILKAMVERCIAGIGSDHHRNLFKRLSDNGFEGVSILNNHAARHFAVAETQATDSDLAQKLGNFFSNMSDELTGIEAMVGMDLAIDVSHQDAPFGVVEIEPLFEIGGSPVLMDGGDRKNWKDSFIVSTIKTTDDEILMAIASQIYPRIARAHHDFVSMKGLVIVAPESAKESVKKAIDAIRAEIAEFSQADDGHEKLTFFENICFVSSDKVLKAVA